MSTPPSRRLRIAASTGSKSGLSRRVFHAAALGCLALTPAAIAQRHNGLSSPPTAPPPAKATAAAVIVPVSTGLGALQFVAVNYGVPAPQSLARQLDADDDRTRAAALAAIGAPAQYLNRGNVPYPHSIQLDFIALGVNDQLDAILTVELDQHLVSSVLVPQKDSWSRVATLTYVTAFTDPATTPATFLTVARSLVQHERYRAIFHATTTEPNGSFTVNEAHLRILNGKAVILISFVSSARVCTAKRTGCELTSRWLQPEPTDPTQHTLLVTANGHLTAHQAADPFTASIPLQQLPLHTTSCQPFAYTEATQHYEPTANPGPCPTSR